MVLLVRAVLEAAGKMHVLLSTRLDVALAAGATGVHLGASPGGLKAGQVGQVYVEAGLRIPLVSKACHTLSEVRQATDEGVDLILFGPVFGKNVAGVEVLAGVGVERLREACRVAEGTQIFALGGVDGENSRECVDAGAAGVAGIRLFSR